MGLLTAILCCVVVLGFLVVIHEGGHFLAARAFGVRVTEFMVGLPGPRVGFKWNETAFGVTAIPLGGYARVCGMEGGKESPHLRDVLACVYRHGEVVLEDLAWECGIPNEEALRALDQLVEWGSVTAPKKTDPYNTYRTPEVRKGRAVVSAEGDPRFVDDPDGLFEGERSQQYRSLPFWKRCVILLAGPLSNLLFFMLIMVVVYSVIGIDVQSADGGVEHMRVNPLDSMRAGVLYLAATVQAILGLFNPATAAQTVSDSAGVVGIAVISKAAFEQGLLTFVMFSALISVSLGLMNLLPIPPLDGGRIIVEVIQKITGREIPVTVVNAISLFAMALFFLFFIFMINQDVQRFVLGG